MEEILCKDSNFIFYKRQKMAKNCFYLLYLEDQGVGSSDHFLLVGGTDTDERTLELHGDDIRYDLMFMNFLLNNVRFPGEGLAPRYKELKFNKVADFYAGMLNGNIAKKLRQPDFDQQALANDFQELHEVMTIARLCGNNAMAEKIRKMADTQFDAMEASAPGMGAAYRNFFYGINAPASAEETADTTDTESPEGEK